MIWKYSTGLSTMDRLSALVDSALNNKHVKVYIETDGITIQIPAVMVSIETRSDYTSQIYLESVEGIHTMPGIFSANVIVPDRWICKFCFTENNKNSGSCDKCGSPKGLSV